MAGHASTLGSLHAVDGEGVVRMEGRFDTGIDDVWQAITAPDRLSHWFGAVAGDPASGDALAVHIALGGPRTGQVEACEPRQRLLLTMRDPEPQPGQPDMTVIEAKLHAQRARAPRR
jgi:uncharacterized protein YndB with AHSA1/START domain